MVARGYSKDQILTQLQSRVPNVNITSQRNPLYAWGAPLVAIAVVTLLFAIVGVRVLRSRRARAADASGATAGRDTVDSPGATDDPADPSLRVYRELLKRELGDD